MEEDTRLVLEEPEDEILPDVEIPAETILMEPAEAIDPIEEQKALVSYINNEITNLYNDIDSLNSLLISFKNLPAGSAEIINEIIDQRHYDIGRLTSIKSAVMPEDADIIHKGMEDAKFVLEGPEEYTEVED